MHVMLIKILDKVSVTEHARCVAEHMQAPEHMQSLWLLDKIALTFSHLSHPRQVYTPQGELPFNAAQLRSDTVSLDSAWVVYLAQDGTQGCGSRLVLSPLIAPNYTTVPVMAYRYVCSLGCLCGLSRLTSN